jgi:hypothetical protein
MATFTLKVGTWTGSLSFILAGCAGLVAADPWTPAWYVSWLSITVGIGIFAWGVRINGQLWFLPWRWWNETEVTEHQKELYHRLADALAEMKASALTVGGWERNSPTPGQIEHSRRHHDITMRAGALIDQISYDKPTADTCRDFAQLCHFIVYDAIHKQDYRQSRLELDRLSAGLFRYLHAGKSVNRKGIDLPDWIRKQDEEAAERGRDRDRSSVRRDA